MFEVFSATCVARYTLSDRAIISCLGLSGAPLLQVGFYAFLSEVNVYRTGNHAAINQRW